MSDECDEHKCTAGCPYSMCRAGALTSTNWYDESGCIDDEWSRAEDGALMVHVQYSDDSDGYLDASDTAPVHYFRSLRRPRARSASSRRGRRA